eukprot:32087-Alexandrium_andersonii.AAC.1
MSASLVGSEMCIRDSCTMIARAPDFLRMLLLELPPLKQVWTFPTATREPCLLYTSDAADDM